MVREHVSNHAGTGPIEGKTDFIRDGRGNTQGAVDQMGRSLNDSPLVIEGHLLAFDSAIDGQSPLLLIEKAIGIVEQNILIGGNIQQPALEKESVAPSQVHAVIGLKQSLIDPIGDDLPASAGSGIDFDKATGFIRDYTIDNQSDTIGVIDRL